MPFGRTPRHLLTCAVVVLSVEGVWAQDRSTPIPSRRVQLVYATCVTLPEVYERGEGRVIARFMAENPEIEVVARQIPFESYDTQVLLSCRGGHPPDVARVNHCTLRMWAGAGYLLALDDFIGRSKWIEPADYWKGFWDICKVSGHQYAVPLGTDCRVMIYHLGLFRNAGVSVPKTWAELVDVARRIHRPEQGVYGLAFPASDEWAAAYDAIGNFLVANGGYILHPDGTRGTAANDPAAVEAFRFACDLVTVHKVCPPGMANLSGNVIEALFVDGRLGMLFSGPWVRVSFRRLRPDFQWKVDYDMALVPAGPSTGRSGSSQGGWLIAAFSGSRHAPEALRLLEYFSRPESLAIIGAIENLPPRRAAMALGPFADPFYRVFFEQLPTSRPPLAVVPQLPNVARAVQRAYQRVVAGGATVDEATRWLEDKVTHDLLR